MSILTNIPPEPSKTTAAGAVILRRQLKQTVDMLELNLKQIRATVSAFGKQNLIAELGNENASAMNSIYVALKNALEIEAVGKTITAL